MSCVNFMTPEQRSRLGTAQVLTPEEIAAAHPLPPRTTGKVQRVTRMARAESAPIRASAAAHPLAEGEVLNFLAADEDVTVRRCVARNEHAPAAALETLAADPDSGVRGCVASNRQAPPALLDRLSEDADPMVRSVVAWNRRWDADRAG